MPSLETEAPRTFRSRSLLAFGVAAVWGLSAMPFFLGISSCPTARLLHTPCPGCGMSRALSMVAHGDVGASLVMHPLAVPTLLVQGAFANWILPRLLPDRTIDRITAKKLGMTRL